LSASSRSYCCYSLCCIWTATSWLPCRECWLHVETRKAISGWYHGCFPLILHSFITSKGNYVSVSVRKCGCFIAESYLACIIVLFDRQFFWGTGETLVPVYQKMEEAFEKHPGVSNRLRKLCVVVSRSISSILPSWKH
jgi:hypothetical protein